MSFIALLCVSYCFFYQRAQSWLAIVFLSCMIKYIYFVLFKTSLFLIEVVLLRHELGDDGAAELQSTCYQLLPCSIWIFLAYYICSLVLLLFISSFDLFQTCHEYLRHTTRQRIIQWTPMFIPPRLWDKTDNRAKVSGRPFLSHLLLTFSHGYKYSLSCLKSSLTLDTKSKCPNKCWRRKISY